MGKPSATDLLEWYDRHARRLPWRVPPAQAGRGRQPDPYRIWLSEVMLQQTTVVTVGPYFRAFLERWPTVADLAVADLDEVLHAWAGLGYYARARNLHKCARAVADGYGGVFPDTQDGLRALPGIGPYTAAAIAAIAFDRPATVVDGNVERVMARLFAVEESLPAAKGQLHALAEGLTPRSRPGDYAQAVMDLGATVCTPRSPKCLMCPWQGGCRAQALGIAETLPRRAPKAERPLRQGVAFWTMRSDGAVLLRRRPERGLLGGMMEVPSSDWAARQPADPAQAPLTAEWRELPGLVNHGFTHFRLELIVLAAQVRKNAKADGLWIMPEALGDHALPTLTKKVVRHAFAHV
ncbi:MAG: A/G-specific adenine glycosylase [Alphaproteobacteria bacterium]|jgi:A/G-specific adenine glycosylase